ncbi:MAG: helix-turn-helix domain-containing protein [Anaerolineae bacterium]
MVKCQYCHATQKQVKSGHNPSGSQRYLCKICGRVYTPKPRRNGYPGETRRRAVDMYQQGMSIRAVGRLLKIGPQTVANWVHATEARSHKPCLTGEATLKEKV